MRKDATLSPCGAYRYRLSRQWSGARAIGFVMLNPSTADADVDDPTIRRCVKFAQREGAGGIVVANLFAYRAAKPIELSRAREPFGPLNRQTLRELGEWSHRSGSPIICAWGAFGWFKDANQTATSILANQGAKLCCLAKTKEGHPGHPLYLRADAPLQDFP